MKILISGGHLTPALAVIHAFHRKAPETKIVFVGREFLQEKERMRSREREEIEKRHLRFHSIPAAKFHRTHVLRNFEELFRFIPSLIQSFSILRAEKPDVFLSFGGYLAVPLALASWALGISVLTHEQTKTAGLANQVIARVAKTVLLSYEESKRHFAGRKTLVTGNPIRLSFSRSFRKKPNWLQNTLLRQPLIYVTGGSQGSHIINQTIQHILADLTASYIVIHQCGASANSSYYRELLEKRNTLPAVRRKRYIVREWIGEEDVAWIMQHAALVVARSGANTVQEVQVSRVPAIFIPLPFAHNNEQLKNAQPFADRGSAVILPQKNLIPAELLKTIKQCMRKNGTMRKRAELFDAESDAAERIVLLCLATYDNTKRPAPAR